MYRRKHRKKKNQWPSSGEVCDQFCEELSWNFLTPFSTISVGRKFERVVSEFLCVELLAFLQNRKISNDKLGFGWYAYDFVQLWVPIEWISIYHIL